MSFFIKGKQLNKAKRAKFSKDNNKKRKVDSTATKSRKNDEITSSEDEEEIEDRNEMLSSEEDERETAQEKKLRLAKVYLQEIEKEEKARLEREEVDNSVLSRRLKEDYLKDTGKLRLNVADKYQGISETKTQILKCKQQRNSITCFCLTQNDNFLFVGSKDGIIVKYCLKTHTKIGLIPYVKQNNGSILGHTSEILSLAISTDNKFLVSGDKSGDIQIWDPTNLNHIKTLSGHKNSVLGLTFKRESHTLYSCSKDKTVKVWNLDEMMYVESLFGHQDIVASIDTLYRDRVVSSGGKDIRVWKITEETQLIYNGHNGNIDNVKLINEENFATAGDDGQICFWSINRKKPLHIIEKAHGLDPSNNQPYWITAIAAHTNTDLIASGSNDGFVRLWKLENGFKLSNELFKIPVDGFVNALTFTSNGQELLVGVSREYRFGRWSTVRQVKNCVMVFYFNIK